MKTIKALKINKEWGKLTIKLNAIRPRLHTMPYLTGDNMITTRFSIYSW
jgi:hypothetical protein